MKTLLTSDPFEAGAIVRRGGIVAFPTETVYGLGAAVSQELALNRIFEAKGRPADNPLIVHLASIDQLERVVADVTPEARRIIDAFFPGPVTVVLPKAKSIPAVVTAGLDTVAVRMPSGPLTRAFLKACGDPVAAPSANLSGRPSPTTWQAVLHDLDGRIAAILQGPQAVHGLESTVVDCTGGIPVVLRAGALSLEELRGVVPSTRAAKAVDEVEARSPGMRHRHYAPSARVRVVATADDVPTDPERKAFIGLHGPADEKRFVDVLVCGSLEQYGFELYHFFRRCDEAGLEAIYCEAVDEVGLGRAIMDRLRRAAAATDERLP
ncbi:MAG TPA: L-threonylcarbamoyladenylate synthase [Rhodothermales bacterium]